MKLDNNLNQKTEIVYTVCKKMVEKKFANVNWEIPVSVRK